MSLVASYNLINDAHDTFHHSDLLPSPSFASDGALGSCLNLTTRNQITLSALKDSEVISFSAWVKFENEIFTLFSKLFYFSVQWDNSGINNDALRVEISGQDTNNISLNVFNNGGWTGDGGFGSATMTRNAWHHIVMACFKNKLEFYVDGVRKFSTAKRIDLAHSYDTSFNGNFTINQSAVHFKLWNFKIFSHPLSKREVSDLYKTCVTHFSFNDPMLNYENLYTGTQLNASWMTINYNVQTDVFSQYGISKAIKFIPSHSNTDSTNFMAYSYLVSTALPETSGYGTTRKYGVSMYCYVSEDCNANFDLTLEGSSYFDKFYVSEDATLSSNKKDIICSTKGKAFLLNARIVPTTKENDFKIMFYFNKNQSLVFTTGYIYVAAISLFPLNENDDFFGPMSLIGKSPTFGSLRDVSGFGNHATATSNNILLSRETALGSYSLKTQNDGSGFIFPFPLKKSGYEGTVEFWVKLNSSHTYQSVVGLINDSNNNYYGGTGFWIALNTEGAALWFYNSKYYKSSKTSLNLNTWYHVACTFIGTTLTRYCNGEKLNSINNNTAFNINSSWNRCILGGYYVDGVSWNTKLDSYIADFKIYARPLSDSEIKEDSLRRISFTNIGSIKAESIEEKESFGKIKMSKGAAIKGMNINELGIQDMKVKVLDDGSCWARIFHHETPSTTNLFAYNEGPKVRSADGTKYSLFYLLANSRFKNKSNQYEFLLEYPNEYPNKYNRWTQTSNPCTTSSVSNYNPIHIDWTTQNFGGILLSSEVNGSTYLKCDTGTTWFYAIGSRDSWETSIPGPGSAVTETNVYIRIDNIQGLEESTENLNPQKIGKNYISANQFLEE